MDLDDVRASLIMRNEISVPQIMQEFGASYTEAREAIKSLEESGEIKKTDGVMFVGAEEVLTEKNDKESSCAIIVTRCDRPLDERKIKMLCNKANLSPDVLKEKLESFPFLICRGGSAKQLHHLSMMMRITLGMDAIMTTVDPDYKMLTSDKMYRAERSSAFMLEIMASDLGLRKETAKSIALGLLDEAIEINAPDRAKNAMADAAERFDNMSEKAFEEYKKILNVLYKSKPSNR